MVERARASERGRTGERESEEWVCSATWARWNVSGRENAEREREVGRQRWRGSDSERMKRKRVGEVNEKKLTKTQTKTCLSLL